MRFRPVLEEGVMVRVLVILTDVTSTVEGERAQRRAREVEAVMLSFVRDRDGMIAFVREAERILLDLEHVEEPATVRRLVHTLKGGSAAAGFVTVAEECHAIESELLESGQPTLERAQHVRLSRAFQERLGMIAELLPSDDGALRLGAGDLHELETAIKLGVRHGDLLAIIELWRWPHVRDALRRVAVQIERIATSLHKRVEVRVEDHGLRHVPHRLDEKRASVGKSESGLIVISARVVGSSLVIEMADDGQGVNVEHLRTSAEKRGLHRASEKDVMDLLFADGVSTRIEVTEHSGRGVGLAAVRAACEAAGGTARVTSRAGYGTTFAFHFPSTLAHGMTTFVLDKEDYGTTASGPRGRAVRSLRSCRNCSPPLRGAEPRQSPGVRACETASAAPRAKHGHVRITTLTLDPIAGL